MALNLRLQTKLTQQLVLTPQLQLSIKILQLNHLELKESIEQEVQENPLLEVIDDLSSPDNNIDADFQKFIDGYSKINEDYLAKEKFNRIGNSSDEEDNNFENYHTKKPELSNHLLWQLHLEDLTPKEAAIGEEIIGNIEPDGYLRISVVDLAQSTNSDIDEVEKVLKKIQQFDPVGIGSRDLRECLLSQLDVYTSPVPFVRQIVENHLDDLSRKNFKKIAKELSMTIEEVENALCYINGLNPKPGNSFEFSAYESQQIQPDVFITKEGNEYIITLNFENMPYLKINRKYELLLKNKSIDPATKEFLQEKIKSAYWFIKSVYQRGNTIYRVAKAIVDKQREFFDNGVGSMKPLTLKDLSEVLELHESTISRVTSNKYMLTPRGFFEMKYFFSTGIRKTGSEDVASITVKELIKGLTENEDHKSPMSDQDMSDMLKAKGYSIARRTVTKYREGMNILSSGLRKK
jgi:RNA polymerase sigma-54 factor